MDGELTLGTLRTRAMRPVVGMAQWRVENCFVTTPRSSASAAARCSPVQHVFSDSCHLSTKLQAHSMLRCLLVTSRL